MQDAGLDESQAGIKTVRREISATSDMQMITILLAEKWRGIKEPLDEGANRVKKWA